MHRVILVRPKYAFNVGMVARAMNNFGFSELVLVGGKNKAKTFTANMYAKHSKSILKKAKNFRTLSQAVAGCDLVVGTTGVLQRFRKDLKTCMASDRLSEKIHGRKAALVFGAEDKGLSEAEIARCDVLVHIPASQTMPILNLSHAVAVLLYELGRKKNFVDHGFHPAPMKTRQVLEEKFARLIRDADRVKNKKKVALAFHRLLSRALPSEGEAQALMAGLAALEEKNDENGNQNALDAKKQKV